jgi:plastocyanin
MNRSCRNTSILALLMLLAIGSYVTSRANGLNPGADASSAGSVAGTVRLEGVAPHPSRIVMVNDDACAKLHPGGATADDVVVGANGSLSNVIVYVSDGLSGGPFEPPATPITIEQKGCMYKPHVLAVQANQKVRIINSDGTTHNVHAIPQNNREWNKSQPPGMQPVEEAFAREEIAIPLKCNIHPWMRSYVAVFKHPYFAVTAKDGGFDIHNLPPGTYTLTAWHEKLGTQIKKISIGPNGADKVEFVFKSPLGN